MHEFSIVSEDHRKHFKRLIILHCIDMETCVFGWSCDSYVAVLLRYINLLLLDVFIGRMILHQVRTISLPLIKGKLTENAS